MDDEHTSELFRKLDTLSDRPDGYAEFQKTRKTSEPETLQDYLNEYMAKHQDLTLSQIIFDSNLSKNYVYQFFNGHAKNPDKYKLIPVCIAMRMSVKETDRALFLAGQARLYPKSPLDAALIICLNRGCGNMQEVNEFLLQNGLEEL